MNKRIKKKVGKFRCLKCGRQDGVHRISELKTGRMVISQLICFNCDMGYPVEIYDKSNNQ